MQTASNADLGSRIFPFYVALALFTVFFQKAGLQIGTSYLELLLPVSLIVFGYMLIKRLVTIDSTRLLFLAGFVASLLASQLFADDVSVLGIALLVALVVPLALRCDVSAPVYLRCMNVLSVLACVSAALTFSQHAVQLTVGGRFWPNLNQIVPETFRFEHYVYLQPLKWRSGFMKPNAMFFLEASFLSQFLALGMVVEFALWRRPLRLLLITSALLATFAGTGLVILVAVAPLLVARLPARVLGVTLVLAFVAFVGLLATGWFDQVLWRLGRFDQEGSSGNSRFVAPLTLLASLCQDPSAYFQGSGVGSTIKDWGTSFWNIAKLASEAGLLTAVTYTLATCYCIFSGPPRFRIAWAIFIFDNFLGAATTPWHSTICVLFVTLLRVAPEVPEGIQESLMRAALDGSLGSDSTRAGKAGGAHG